MKDREDQNRDVDQFLAQQVDSVPHLEALLLLWNSRPKVWSSTELAKVLFLTPEECNAILDDLLRQRLVAAVAIDAGEYRYEPSPARDELMAAVDAAYRHELIRITRLIHSKPSAAVRAFARAFRIKEGQN